jgi:hypothetical protein
MNKPKVKLVIAAVAALVAEVVAPSFSGVAQAAPPPPFAAAFIRLDRMESLTATGGLVCVTTNNTTATPLLGSEHHVQITFPTQGTGTDFVVNATAGNWTVSTAANLNGTSLAWPGIGTATNVTGKTVTFPSTALAASTQYCFTFSATNTLTNGTPGGSTDELTGDILTEDNSGTPVIINQTNYAVAVITNDQIAVSAIVPPAFIFTISGNTDAFTNELNPTAIESTTGVSYEIITNAKGGWITWVKDSQQGLYSPTANYTIASVPYNTDAPTVLSASGTSEGYGMFASIVTDAAGGCSVATDPEYTESGGSATSEVGQLAAGYLPDATCTGAPPATDNGSTVKLTERASIAGGTPAGSDYADIITVTAAGNF